ncbi:MAG: DUF4494 family protein [Paludibacteraceae bacterium]
MLYYEIKVNYQRQSGEDNPKGVKETYLVEGVNCADVEKCLMTELKPLIFGDCEVTSCKKVQFYDMIDNNEGEWWFKARVDMITVEDDGKEKRKGVNIYVHATEISDALTDLKKYLNTLDCEIVSIAKSPVLEVFHAVN